MGHCGSMPTIETRFLGEAWCAHGPSIEFSRVFPRPLSAWGATATCRLEPSTVIPISCHASNTHRQILPIPQGAACSKDQDNTHHNHKTQKGSSKQARAAQVLHMDGRQDRLHIRFSSCATDLSTMKGDFGQCIIRTGSSEIRRGVNEVLKHLSTTATGLRSEWHSQLGPEHLPALEQQIREGVIMLSTDAASDEMAATLALADSIFPNARRSRDCTHAFRRSLA